MFATPENDLMVGWGGSRSKDYLLHSFFYLVLVQSQGKNEIIRQVERS